MGQFGMREIILIAIIVLLVFGAKRLPDTARALGKSLRILKSETQAMKADSQTAPAGPPPATKTIQAAPGDVASARPAQEAPRPAETSQRQPQPQPQPQSQSQSQS